MDNIRRKLGNIRHSWRAVVLLWREEYSFRLQTFAAAITLFLSYVLGISTTQFLIVVLVIGAVFAVEALNTAIEELCDHVTPEEHARIGKVKDLASGASFLIGTSAIVIGAVIFIPRLI